jgi:glycosyltransferase involved in cell wall biosynthesis/ubiquinone/menaquinone biosynthesis C-methylase UbiE
VNGGRSLGDPDLSIVVACYNEGSHLEASVLTLLAAVEPTMWTVEIVFVDDASTDDTRTVLAHIIDEHGARASMRVLHHDHNTGRGRTVTDGMLAARGRFIGFLDIDLEVHPRYIPSMVQALEKDADVAIARRVYRLSASPTFILRHVLSRGYRWLSSRTLGLPEIDSEAGFKFFNRASLLPLLEECRDPGWFWDTEIIALARLRGLRVVEIPCVFQRRQDKRSTLRVVPATLEYLRRLLAFRRRLADPSKGTTAALGSVVRFYQDLWESDCDDPENAARRAFQRSLVARALARLGDVRERNVVEVGPGAGREAAALATAGANIIAVDVARSALLKTRIATNHGAHAVRAVAEALPLGDETVDLIFLQTVLMHLDLPRAAAEWARVLRPSGRIVVLEPLRGNPLVGLYRRWLSPYRRTEPRYVTVAQIRSASPALRLAHHEEHFVVSVLTLLLPERFRWWVRKPSIAVDRLLLRVPGVRRLAWMTLAELEKH